MPISYSLRIRVLFISHSFLSFPLKAVQKVTNKGVLVNKDSDLADVLI